LVASIFVFISGVSVFISASKKYESKCGISQFRPFQLQFSSISRGFIEFSRSCCTISKFSRTERDCSFLGSTG
jgi:hypothetical protein